MLAVVRRGSVGNYLRYLVYPTNGKPTNVHHGREGVLFITGGGG